MQVFFFMLLQIFGQTEATTLVFHHSELLKSLFCTIGELLLK